MEVEVIDLVEEEEFELQYQVSLVQDVFPEADPAYLQEQCEKYRREPLDFLVQSLISEGYPKRKTDDNANAEECEHFSEFSSEMFLKKISDPWEYFDKNKEGKQYKVDSLNYLKDRFRFHSVEVINKTLRGKEYNLTKTKKALEKLKPSRVSKRQNNEITKPIANNNNFLLEVAFIENEKELFDFIKVKEDLRKELRNQAKMNGEFITCNCCFDDEVLMTDIVQCKEGHLFCKGCVKRSSEVVIGDGKFEFPCLTSCSSSFTMETLQGVLPEQMWMKVMRKRQELEVKAAGIDGLESCPFCEYAEIPPEGDKIFNCKSCLKESCRSCKKQTHIPFGCDEYAEIERTKSRNYIEDKMTEALVRVCYKCNKKFIKLDGCNKMTCTCGAIMCYLCREPVRSYEHFKDHNSLDNSKCPLYSKNDDLHIDEVRKAGENAKNEVMGMNKDFDSAYDPFKGLETRKKKSPRSQPPRLHHGRLQRGARRNRHPNHPYHNGLRGIFQFFLEDPFNH